MAFHLRVVAAMPLLVVAVAACETGPFPEFGPNGCENPDTPPDAPCIGADGEWQRDWDGSGGGGVPSGSGGSVADDNAVPGGTGGSSGESSIPGCPDYFDESLAGVGLLPYSCWSGGVGELCGLEVTAIGSIFRGLEGCLALDQPRANDPGRCEGFPMAVVDLGDAIPLPACCRVGGTCGVEVDLAQLGEALSLPLESADFGCVDPLPILAHVPYESVPIFWMGAREYPEGGAPRCTE